MQTTGEDLAAGSKESLARAGALLLIAVVAMLVVGFQFMSAYKDDVTTIEGTSSSEQ